jgi:signal transduction histidine kinase
LEAAPEDGGEVVIRGRREGGDLLLSVRDNGEGMDKETRDRIFTPFFTTKGPDRGMGLGLTIVWRVARSLGGSVAAESAPGQGAEFRVRLPVARLDEAPQ